MPLARTATVAALVVLTACGGGDPATEPTVPPADATEAAGGTAVRIAGSAFNPAEVSIAAGDTVTWTNEDSFAHTVTFDDDSHDSGSLGTGDTFEHTFDAAGTFGYHCDIHPTMGGTVTVG